MSEPKVSVVMPVHDARRFIDQAIRSILSQTFADFEFVILDDSSTDGSVEISRAWARQDDRIRVFENQARLGHSATSNLAVSLARGKYVARMDADDVSHPERLAKEWQILSQSANIVLGTLADGIDAEGNQVRPRDRWRIIRRSSFAPFAHGSIIFSKEVFDARGQQEHASLVRYIRQFDVCIVPYVSSHVTATVVPTKINEYLAVGKPVVSTELPAGREFNAQHDILHTTTTEPKSFLLAIERSLQLGTDEAAIARGRAVAELGNWEPRLEAMTQLIETKLSAQANTGVRPSIL